VCCVANNLSVSRLSFSLHTREKKTKFRIQPNHPKILNKYNSKFGLFLSKTFPVFSTKSIDIKSKVKDFLKIYKLHFHIFT